MSMEVYRTVADFRAACDELRARGEKLGLVPTMGALHEGHLALVDHARSLGSKPAVTVFVNPTQFGPQEDFDVYPRTLERDLSLCSERGVWAVFVPTVEEMYPPGEATRVQVSRLTEALCGARRPGHFDGVATVVTKLFAVAGSCVAVFGRKDYQQLQVIRRLAKDLLLPVDVVGFPTVREPDGLALSSRNAMLGPVDRQRALVIAQALSRAHGRYLAGERGVRAVRVPVIAELEEAGFRIDYVELADADLLVPFPDNAEIPGRALLAVAVFLGSTRLIDSLVLGEDPPPIRLEDA